MRELKKQIEKGLFHSCYLFYGSEAYLMRLYEERLKNAVLASGDQTMNCDCFQDKKTEAAAILDAADTMPFLSDKRFVEVKDSGLFQAGRKNDSEKIANYIGNIPESTCLLFMEKEVDKRGKLYKAVVKNGYAVEFKGLSEKELITWMIREMKKRNIEVEAKTAVYLIRTVGDGMDQLMGEIEKLAAYKNGEGALLPEDIDAVCIKSLELRIFDLMDALGNQKPQEALTIYRNLLKMKEAPIKILTLLTRQFRIIYQCKVLLEQKESASVIAARTGLRDFIVKSTLRQASHFSVERLRQGLEDCLKTDVQIKTGQMGGEMAVELLIIQYSAIG